MINSEWLDLHSAFFEQHPVLVLGKVTLEVCVVRQVKPDPVAVVKPPATSVPLCTIVVRRIVILVVIRRKLCSVVDLVDLRRVETISSGSGISADVQHVFLDFRIDNERSVLCIAPGIVLHE